MLSCDLVVAADHATFGLPEVKRGLFAAAGGLIRLPKRIPTALATEIAITGDPIDAARAHQLGLVNCVVPQAQVVDAAVALAGRIAANGPLAIRNSLRMVREAGNLSDEAAWARNTELALEVFRSKDSIEGATAFAEKRRAALDRNLIRRAARQADAADPARCSWVEVTYSTIARAASAAPNMAAAPTAATARAAVSLDTAAVG